MTWLYRFLAGKLWGQLAAMRRAEMPMRPVTPPRNPAIKPRFIIRPPVDDAVEAERIRDRIEQRRRLA